MQRIRGLAMVALQHFHRMSMVTRAFAGLIIIFYFLSFFPKVEENLVMTPAYIVPPNVKIWTLLTATFYESSIVFVVLDVLALVGFSSVLEPLWDFREFLIFSALVSSVSILSGAAACVLLYAIARSFSYLLVPFYGLISLVCGYVVAIKQFHPDSVAFPPPAPPTLRVKHLPLLILVIALLLCLCRVVSFAFPWLAMTGTLTSWVYLRFYQKRSEGGRGDMSESFAFATFFPEPIQPPIASLGGFFYHVLVSAKVCPKTVRTYDVGAPSTIRLTLPGTDPADAQRRKQRALKELDKRLKKADNPPTWPSMEDGSSSQEEMSPSSPTLPLLPSASSGDKLQSVVVEKMPSSTRISQSLPQDKDTPPSTQPEATLKSDT